MQLSPDVLATLKRAATLVVLAASSPALADELPSREEVQLHNAQNYEVEVLATLTPIAPPEIDWASDPCPPCGRG